ncbi:MAG: hypothetical protein ACXVCO_04795 [Ktedonobacterales bacterium]
MHETQQTAQYHVWLERLKHIRESTAERATCEQEKVPKSEEGSTDKTDRSALPAHTAAATPIGNDSGVVWRVAAFRAIVPKRGPVWPIKIRSASQTDTPGHCSLCGDPLPTDDAAPRFPRCQACIAALSHVLNNVRGFGS